MKLKTYLIAEGRSGVNLIAQPELTFYLQVMYSVWKALRISFEVA